MKKFFTGVVSALLLVAVMGTTVFAAGSPTGEDALKQQVQTLNNNITNISARTSNNTIVTVTKTETTTEQLSDAKKVADGLNSSATVMAMSNLTVPEGTDTSRGVTVTLYVPGVHRGDNVYILHQTANGNWEVLKPSSVADGYVTVTLYSFSPIVVVKYNNGVSVSVTTQPSGSTTNNSTNSNNTTGDTQNNSQNNNNNQNNNQNNSQNNNQNNNQNNSVNVEQNVTVNYPGSDNGDYDDGYADGYEDGKASASNRPSSGSSTNKGSSGSSVSKKTDVKSPKTGETLPVAPVIGLLAAVGIGLAGRKFR